MKRNLHSKRGVAIEMAIVAMLMITALSLILLTTSIHESKRAKSAREDLASEVAITEVAEAAFATGADVFPSDANPFSAIYTFDGDTVTVTVKQSDAVVLVATSKDGTITSWVYK